MTSFEHLHQKYKRLLITKKEAAEELLISTASFDRLRKSGQIKTKRVGGSVYVSIKDLSSYIDA